MKGWISDIYPDLKKGKMIVWLRTDKHCHKVVEDYDPGFYLKARDDDYSMARRAYQGMDFRTEMVERKTTIYDDREREVMKVSPGRVFDPKGQADALQFFEGYQNYRFYNVDIPLDQRYMIDRGIRPFSLVKKDQSWEELESDDTFHYAKPELREIYLEAEISSEERVKRMEDELRSVMLDGERIEGDEGKIIAALNKKIERRDPDVIITSGGDDFLLPYLDHRAELNDKKLVLGREPTSFRSNRGSSYHSYGRVIYKPSPQLLKGRIHIDTENCFLYSEGGIDGLIELSRLSKVPVQRLARRSPGSAINAMETEEAMKDGYLIPWKENITEEFKTAEELLSADRGGHIFEPRVGIHRDVFKLDFASMYPTIIDQYNLSPETMGCKCGKYHTVPELGYRICERDRGLIPRVVGPLVKRRQRYKELSSGSDQYSRRAQVLKWLLVTCFGYTGYKKARFSNIEVHASITAYGRDILLEAADIAQDMGYEVLHGIVDSLWLKGDKRELEDLIERVSRETKVPLESEGVYSWVVFLPTKTDLEIGAPNRYFGVLDGELEAKGVHLKRSDTPEFFRDLQEKMLKQMRELLDEGSERVLSTISSTLKRAHQMIMNREISPERLYFTKKVSRRAEDYEHMTESKAALMQYEERGMKVQPGQKIRYVVSNARSSDHMEKVKIGVDVGEILYDTEYYHRYLCRAAEELLAPFGCTAEDIDERVKRR